MPYLNEYANPRGYEDLFDAHLLERLKTFRFEPPKTTTDDDLLENFVAKKVKDLPLLYPLHELKYACAVDGSITRLEETSPFELAALKIGSVLENLHAMKNINEASQLIDPEAIDNVYQVRASTMILSGKGIYGEDETEALWQDKFRLELNEALKNVVLPASNNLTLHEALKNIMPKTTRVACFTCSLAGHREKDILVNSNVLPACPRCAKDHYLTDGLFGDWNPLKESANNVYLHLMTTLERLILHGVMAGAQTQTNTLPYTKTLFITDGSLAFYGLFHHLNSWLLNDLQSWDKMPLLVSLEKNGVHRDFALNPIIQQRVGPGEVALVPSEISARLSARTQESAWGAPLYAYGKRFIYRSLNGEKTFVLMLPPRRGRPHKYAADDVLADSWDNYPTLRLTCEFLEAHSIALFGPQEPAIDIVAKANHAASLPKILASQTLKDIIKEHVGPH